MRRVPLPSRLARWSAAVGVVCALLVGVLLGPVTSTHHGDAVADSTYRVDVIFDTAKGIIPGQLVKIAGARVGTIKDVVLTPDFKARIQMEVDRRFAPFRKDASCNIQPEGLISERFVQCDPGTAAAGELRSEDGQAPTVPVSHTTALVALTDLFNIFRVPVRERFSVIVSTLGLGLAGRGEDVNDILRRANPTLKLTRQALQILGSQRAALKDTVQAVDKLAADLAKRPQAVSQFIDDAAKVSRTTAAHRSSLQDAIRRLPGLLDETQPAMQRLSQITEDGTPILRDLRAATPAASGLVDRIKPFADAADPALSHLSKTADTGRSTLTAAAPVVKLLRTFASAAGPTGQDLNKLLVNLQERGGVENLLSFVYHGAAVAARYDSISHLVPAHAFFNACGQYAEKPVAGCSAKYGPDEAPEPARRKAKASKPQRTGPAASAEPATPQTPGTPSTPAGPTLKLPGLPAIQLPSLGGLLDGSLLNGGASGRNSGGTVGSLLNYLLGR